jgi:hypothetical protein
MSWHSTMPIRSPTGMAWSMSCGCPSSRAYWRAAVSAQPIVPYTGISVTDGLAGAREKKSVFWALSAKNVAQIAARSQHLRKSSRSQSEKRGDRVVLKVKIESFSECGVVEYQRDSRVVFKVAPQDAFSVFAHIDQKLRAFVLHLLLSAPHVNPLTKQKDSVGADLLVAGWMYYAMLYWKYGRIRRRQPASRSGG